MTSQFSNPGRGQIENESMLRAAQVTLERAFTDVSRQLRWSFLPPLIYFASGFSGLTGIVGTFFVKEYLGAGRTARTKEG